MIDVRQNGGGTVRMPKQKRRWCFWRRCFLTASKSRSFCQDRFGSTDRRNVCSRNRTIFPAAQDVFGSMLLSYLVDGLCPSNFRLLVPSLSWQAVSSLTTRWKWRIIVIESFLLTGTEPFEYLAKLEVRRKTSSILSFSMSVPSLSWQMVCDNLKVQ